MHSSEVVISQRIVGADPERDIKELPRGGEVAMTRVVVTERVVVFERVRVDGERTSVVINPRVRAAAAIERNYARAQDFLDLEGRLVSSIDAVLDARERDLCV